MFWSAGVLLTARRHHRRRGRLVAAQGGRPGLRHQQGGGGGPERPRQAGAERVHRRPAGDRAGHRLRPPLHRRHLAVPLRHADPGQHPSQVAADLGALAAPRPVGADPRNRHVEPDQLGVQRRRRDAGREDGDSAHRRQAELPGRGRLRRLRGPGQPPGRHLPADRPELPAHEHRLRLLLQGDPHRPRLPVAGRRRGAQLRPLPAHRLRPLPECPPADLPASVPDRRLEQVPRPLDHRPAVDPQHHRRRHQEHPGDRRQRAAVGAHDGGIRGAHLPAAGADRHRPPERHP